MVSSGEKDISQPVSQLAIQLLSHAACLLCSELVDWPDWLISEGREGKGIYQGKGKVRSLSLLLIWLVLH